MYTRWCYDLKYLELQSLAIFWILWRDHYPQWYTSSTRFLYFFAWSTSSTFLIYENSNLDIFYRFQSRLNLGTRTNFSCENFFKFKVDVVGSIWIVLGGWWLKVDGRVSNWLKWIIIKSKMSKTGRFFKSEPVQKAISVNVPKFRSNLSRITALLDYERIWPSS